MSAKVPTRITVQTQRSTNRHSIGRRLAGAWVVSCTTADGRLAASTTPSDPARREMGVAVSPNIRRARSNRLVTGIRDSMTGR